MATTHPLRHGLLVGLSLQAACLTRDVPDDRYADDVRYLADAPADSTPDTPTSKPSAPSEPSTPSEPSAPSSGGDVDSGDDAGSAPPASGGSSGACDFSGRWLISERRVANGLGVQQAGLQWNYLELTQSGAQLNVTKGLVCGTEVKPIGFLSASVKMDGCWSNLMEDNVLEGDFGTATESAGGCELATDRWYSVFGATASHYRDPSVPMPTPEEEATDSTAGWEDCDGDGMPGAALHVGGILTGIRSCAIRMWSEYRGSVPTPGDRFQVPLEWGQDEAVLAVTSEALKATGVRDGDDSLHFAQFVRLEDDQATGSDDEICASVRALAPQLTPEANK